MLILSLVVGTGNLPHKQLLRVSFFTEVGNSIPTQPLAEDYTIILLTVIVTLGCILIILFLLTTVIIILISEMAVYINRKVWQLFRVDYHLILIIFQKKAIPDPQLQTNPSYSTRKVFLQLIRGVTSDISDYEYA